MSKMDEAQQRLQRAVLGLEEAVRVAAKTGGLSAETLGSDPQVTAALESAQARNAELEAVSAAVVQRLDGAIDRIKNILED